MAIYRFDKDQDQIRPLHKTTFEELGIYERSDIQRLVRNQIEILSEDLLVIAEEFASWDNSKISIDLLCIDKQANLVVVPKIRVRDFFGADFAEIRGAERFWRSPRRCRAGLRAGRGRKGRRSGTGAKDQ